MHATHVLNMHNLHVSAINIDEQGIYELNMDWFIIQNS